MSNTDTLTNPAVKIQFAAEYTAKEAKKLKEIKTFRLIGRTNIFTAVKQYKAGGFVPAVYGVTEINGKAFSTSARLADIIALS